MHGSIPRKVVPRSAKIIVYLKVGLEQGCMTTTAIQALYSMPKSSRLEILLPVGAQLLHNFLHEVAVAGIEDHLEDMLWFDEFSQQPPCC